MPTTPALEQVLADATEQAAILRAHGHVAQAMSLEGLAEQVRACMRGYLTTLSDSEAQLRSGWAVDRLRGKFPEWEAAGMAMLDERGKRRYRECVVPVRLERSEARLAGLRGDSLRGARG